jgi:hypothetical protein
MLTVHPGRVGAGRKFLIFQDLFRTDRDLSFESEPGCVGEKKNDTFERKLLEFGDVACAEPEVMSAVILLSPRDVAISIIAACTEQKFTDNLTVVGYGFGCLVAKWFASLAPSAWAIRNVVLLDNVLENPILVRKLASVPVPTFDHTNIVAGEWLLSKTRTLCTDNPHFDVLVRYVIDQYLANMTKTVPRVLASITANNIPVEWDYLKQIPIFRSNPTLALSLVTGIPKSGSRTYKWIVLCAIIILIIFIAIVSGGAPPENNEIPARMAREKK